jgi:hypothetical protein
MSVTTKLGYRDYAAIAADGQRHEIIDGEHYVNPAPNLYHQTVSKRLQYQLYMKIELTGLGTLYNAPCDVQLSDHDIVQPDLLKRRLYERYAVREYWIVDPLDYAVEQLVLRGSQYRSQTIRDELRPEFVGGVVIDLQQVW